MEQDRGFFESLFDFSFTSFVTPKLIKIVYGILLFFIAIGTLVVIVSGFGRGVGMGLLFLFIVGPLYALILAIFARIYMEILMAVFRIVDLLAEISAQGRTAS